MVFRSLRWSIFLLGAIGVLAALLVAVQGFWLQGRMDTNAGEVFVSKDVVADILPPPMYLIETAPGAVASGRGHACPEPQEAQKQFDRLDGRIPGPGRPTGPQHPPYGLESAVAGAPARAPASASSLAAARSQVIERLERRRSTAPALRRGLARGACALPAAPCRCRTTRWRWATAFATAAMDDFEATRTSVEPRSRPPWRSRCWPLLLVLLVYWLVLEKHSRTR